MGLAKIVSIDRSLLKGEAPKVSPNFTFSSQVRHSMRIRSIEGGGLCIWCGYFCMVISSTDIKRNSLFACGSANIQLRTTQ
jgi:hypothetical protein